jgi:O-antigen/teichoic acid export membrane protein
MRTPGVFSLMHLAKGSALYGASDVVVALLRFSLIAVYTRIMQPAEFGLYSIIITSLTLAVVFIPLGIPSAVMLRLGPADPAESRTCKDDAFWFLAGLCCVCGVVFYAALVILFPNTLVRTLAPWLFLYAASEITGMVPKVSLRIKEKIAAFSAAKVARILFMAALLSCLLATGVTGIKAVIIAESAASLLEWMLCMAFDRYVPAKPLFSNLRSLLHVGMPLMLVAFALFCIDLSDRYVVYELLGGQATGFYAAAAKVAVAASFFVEAFNSMWFPYYLRTAGARNTTPDEHLRRFASRLLVLFSTVTSLFMLVLPLFVKLHVFGRFFIAEQYHGVTVLVAPLTLGYFFKAAFYVSSTIVIARGKNWTLARAVYSAAIVNIGANVLWASLRPFPDLFATLCAIALSSSVSYAICMVMVSASAGLFPRRFWVTSKTALLCAAMLCLAFVPVPAAARYAAWVLFAAIAVSFARGGAKASTGPT